MLFVASIALTGIAIFIVANQMFQEEEAFKAQEKLESVRIKGNEGVYQRERGKLFVP